MKSQLPATDSSKRTLADFSKFLIVMVLLSGMFWLLEASSSGSKCLSALGGALLAMVFTELGRIQRQLVELQSKLTDERIGTKAGE